MSKHKNQRDEVDRWLLDSSEKAASADELDRFNALLLADPEVRAYVVRRLLDEVLIAEELRVAEAESLFSSRPFPPQDGDKPKTATMC